MAPSLPLKDLTLAVNVLSLQIGNFIREQRINFKTNDIQTKSLNSLVSYVDVEAEKMFVSGLQSLLPEAGFVTEEETVAQQKTGLYWVIDPLDGTTNFMYGVPIFATSVALMYGPEVLLGVVYEINNDEIFYAWQGGGTFLNGQKVVVNPEEKLNRGLLATGFPYYDFSKMPEYMALLQDCLKNTRGMRRLGSAATDLAYVACGRFNGFFEYGLSPWDVAAGALLVQEAGGHVTDFKGKEDYIFGKEILASSTAMYSALYRLIHAHLGEI